MTLTLHWWVLPLALLVSGFVLILFTRIEGNYFLAPTWHLMGGLMLIFAAVCTFIGGWIA